jgi:hypothetical protein
MCAACFLFVTATALASSLLPGYKSIPPVKIDDTTYTVTINAPESGWRAFYMEVEFQGFGLTNFLFTTQVHGSLVFAGPDTCRL